MEVVRSGLFFLPSQTASVPGNSIPRLVAELLLVVRGALEPGFCLGVNLRMSEAWVKGESCSWCRWTGRKPQEARQEAAPSAAVIKPPSSGAPASQRFR